MIQNFTTMWREGAENREKEFDGIGCIIRN